MSSNPYQSPREANDPLEETPPSPNKWVGVVAIVLSVVTLMAMILVAAAAVAMRRGGGGGVLPVVTMGPLASSLLMFGIGRVTEHQLVESIGGIALRIVLVLLAIGIVILINYRT